MSLPSMPPPLTLVYERTHSAITGPSAWTPLARIVLIVGLLLGLHRTIAEVLIQIELADTSTSRYLSRTYRIAGVTVPAAVSRLYRAGDGIAGMAVVAGAAFSLLRFRAARYVVIAGAGCLAAYVLLDDLEFFRRAIQDRKYDLMWVFVYPLSYVSFALISGFALTRPRLFTKVNTG